MSRTILCISDNPSRLLLYRCILELEGYSVVIAATALDGINASKTETLNCAVIDDNRDGSFVTIELAGARPEVPILFVCDESRVPLRIYPQVDMFVADDEAIEELPRCVEETIRRSRRESNEGRRNQSERKTTEEHWLQHEAFVRWIFPW